MKTLMPNWFKIILFGLLFISNVNLNAQTLFLNENFDFAVGSNLAGQNDWILGASATNRVVISNAGLTYPNYPNPSGLAANVVPTTDRVQKYLPEH